jgi:hypothetical protein
MAIDPAAISANPAVTMMPVPRISAAAALVRPAARAKGTVNPSDIPITTSRTNAVDAKCLSTWAGGAGGAGNGSDSVGITAVYRSVLW